MEKISSKRFTRMLILEMAAHLAKHSFDEKIEAKEKELESVADAMYDQFYSDKLALIKSLPNGFLESKRNIYVSFVDSSGNSVCLNYANYFPKDSRQRNRGEGPIGNRSTSQLSIYLSEQRPMPYAQSYSGLKFLSTDPLVKKWLKVNEDIADLKAEKETFEDQMNSMLSEIGNFNDLYTAWPAVRELLIKFEPPAPKPKGAKVLPPATIFDGLNAQLGIPTEKVMVATTA